MSDVLTYRPKDAIVYYEGRNYADDWRRVCAVNNLDAWSTKGVLIQ